jgi:hypothetical protein
LETISPFIVEQQSIIILIPLNGLKREKVMPENAKFRTTQVILCNSYKYIVPSIIRIVKLRRMRWAGHVARMGEKKNAYSLLVGRPEGNRPLGRPRHWWGIILRWSLERWDGVMWTGLVWLRIGTGGELL